MNRTTVVALVATAAVGMIGGTMTAVIRGDNDRPGGSAGPTDRSSRTPSSPGAPTPTSANVLYAGAKTIHDGDRTVRYDAPFDTPDRLVRTRNGWLVSTSTGTDAHPQSSRVYTVAPDGTTKAIAEIADAFDLNDTRDRIVATEVESGAVKVWDVDGEVVRTWPGPRGATRPVWSGELVFASAVVDSGGESEPGGETGVWNLFRWNPATGAAKRLDRGGFEQMAASRDGTLLSGSVGIEGYSLVAENYCLGIQSAPGRPDPAFWDSCDWRLNSRYSQAFSPDGTRILAVPSESDGFGPSLFATFSATDGPTEELQKFAAPKMTIDASWLDDDTLVLFGSTSFDLESGGWIRTCDLAGKCTEVATREDGPLVVGEQY